MSGPVDVLAVLDEAADWLYRSSEGRGDDERSENVKAVRSGVAELIEADKEYDAACAEWDASVHPRSADRLKAARERRAAALANIRSAS
ncbi:MULTISPECIES: hypothetical protein [unclassified Rhodanobacter]|uniref:hypothetical protein n=1 Tax=unclassified Rhodanobacter TaxID=2621553 RepID=UPI001BDE6661|nr:MULTISPECIES: hypothetical protein [unclassified Rhodanobacter]MBT2142722.1 hypothetical protein [Rhodanobacter sp. LX-99]MBT2148205.1 hypothetical protein [Rhodanobacter sp. LX-100]